MSQVRGGLLGIAMSASASGAALIVILFYES